MCDGGGVDHFFFWFPRSKPPNFFGRFFFSLGSTSPGKKNFLIGLELAGKKKFEAPTLSFFKQNRCSSTRLSLPPISNQPTPSHTSIPTFIYPPAHPRSFITHSTLLTPNRIHTPHLPLQHRPSPTRYRQQSPSAISHQPHT